MPTLVHLTAADVRRVPWKNGRGVTDELLVLPEGATFEKGDFDVRISKAVVPMAGPFSSFPGFDRVLVVTDGAGLSLTHGGAASAAVVRPLEPYAFSGDVLTEATLLGGPVSDFNVIVRRGRRRAEVRVVRPGRDAVRETLGAGEAFVHALVGTLEARVGADAGPVRLAPGESLLVRDARRGEAIELVGDGAGAVGIFVGLPR